MPRWETIQSDEPHTLRAYLALPPNLPPNPPPLPGILVIMHGPGVDPFIQNRVESLASHGYAALAPDLFHRQPKDDAADPTTRVARLRDHEILADIDAAVAHLRHLPDAPIDHLAVLGFCMGGRVSYLLAGARPSTWKAAVVFYGGNLMKAWGQGPTPFDLTAHITAPLIAFFGQQDTNPSPADVDKIDAELTRHGKPHTFHRYPDAGHAFLNFTNPERHCPAQAHDAWTKALAFLDAQLRPPRP